MFSFTISSKACWEIVMEGFGGPIADGGGRSGYVFYGGDAEEGRTTGRVRG